MEQYIPKAAVVAEIWRLKVDALQKISQCKRSGLEKIMHQIGAYNKIISFLDTLDVKEIGIDFGDPKGDKSAKCIIDTKPLEVKVTDEVKIGETQIYLEDDGGEPPYDGKQWLDLSCIEYEIPKALFKDGDNVEILIRKIQKGE